MRERKRQHHTRPERKTADDRAGDRLAIEDLLDIGDEGVARIAIGLGVRRRAAGMTALVIDEDSILISEGADLGAPIPCAPGEAMCKDEGRPRAGGLEIEGLWLGYHPVSLARRARGRASPTSPRRAPRRVAVEASDAAPELEAFCCCADSDSANENAVRVAAVRDSFEECGVLLARPRGTQDLSDGTRLESIAARDRDELQKGGSRLLDLVFGNEAIGEAIGGFF